MRENIDTTDNIISGRKAYHAPPLYILIRRYAIYAQQEKDETDREKAKTPRLGAVIVKRYGVNGE